MKANALKAKLSLAFETAAECSTCRYCFDLTKYSSGDLDLSDFGSAKKICRSENRSINLHLKGEEEDGFVAVYECPEEDICEYWLPDIKTKAAPQIVTDMELSLIVNRAKLRILEEDVEKIAKDLGLGG